MDQEKENYWYLKAGFATLSEKLGNNDQTVEERRVETRNGRCIDPTLWISTHYCRRASDMSPSK